MKIEVTDEIDDREVRSKEGQVFRFRNQTGYVDLGGRYPERIQIPLQREQAPYPPGDYQLGKDSFYIDKNRKLQLFVKLVKGKA